MVWWEGGGRISGDEIRRCGYRGRGWRQVSDSVGYKDMYVSPLASEWWGNVVALLRGAGWRALMLTGFYVVPENTYYRDGRWSWRREPFRWAGRALRWREMPRFVWKGYL